VHAEPLQTIIDAWIEGAPPDSIVIVDPIELDRFSKTYYGIWPLPDSLKGPRDRPFIHYLPAH
jgi:hypothetical protein